MLNKNKYTFITCWYFSKRTRYTDNDAICQYVDPATYNVQANAVATDERHSGRCEPNTTNNNNNNLTCKAPVCAKKTSVALNCRLLKKGFATNTELEVIIYQQVSAVLTFHMNQLYYVLPLTSVQH